jgi:hypothetical protein
VGVSRACVDSLEGTLDPANIVISNVPIYSRGMVLPPLPALFIACPPIMLAEAEPGEGDGVADCLEAPTLRI